MHPCNRQNFERWNVGKDCAHYVSVGERGMCACILRILFDCLLEVVYGASQSFRIEPPSHATPAQVEIVGFEIRGCGTDKWATRDTQPDLERLHDRLGDLLLHGKHVGHGAVVRIRPENTSIGVDKLHPDFKTISCPSNTAFQNVINMQQVRDVAHIESLSLERKDRS